MKRYLPLLAILSLFGASSNLQAAASSAQSLAEALDHPDRPNADSAAEAAGLQILRTSNLHNKQDDPLDVVVFDPSVRGKTSKFVVLFYKPRSEDL